MSDILRRLHQDHINCQRLLAILDQQIEVISEGKRPDWPLLQGIFQYFQTYPDTAHHPIENQIVKRLHAKDPGAAEPFLGLEAEHRELSATLRHIAGVTQRLVPTVRDTYLDLLRSFVAGQRDHVLREDAGFLAAANRLFDARDWQALDRFAPIVADPLSDPADGRFLALQRHLASVKAADGGDPR
jgi:hemerythrin-like domain-containing protein